MSGILAGAMGGLAGAAVDIADKHISSQINLDFQREMSAMREQADIRAEERKQRMRRDDDQYAFDKKVERAPQERDMRAEDEVAIGDARRKVKTGEMVDKLGFETENLGQLTANERAHAQARDLDGEGRSLRNDATRLQIDEAKLSAKDRQALRELRDEYRRPETTPERKSEIESQLIVLGSGGQHRYESKVTDDEYGRKRIDVIDRQTGEVIQGGRRKQGATQDKFETGKTYKDANGNKAKYLGNGKWQNL